MKTKVYISIALLFLSSFSIAQKFKTSVALSSGVSWYISGNSNFNNHNIITKNGGLGFCFSGVFREEFYFPKLISLGTELYYLHATGKFASPTPFMYAIPEIHTAYRHTLSINSIDIPILFKIRTDSNITRGIYFYFGGGLSYIFQSYRTVDIITTYDYSSDKQDVSPMSHGTVTINNSSNNKIGTIGIIGFGKNFTIKNKTFFCEAKYRFDFNKWNYPTVNDPVNKSFNIKRQCLLLNFGITF